MNWGIRMADEDTSGDNELERYFRAARGDEGPAPDALVARILADAEAHRVQPGRAGGDRGAFEAVLRALGGWPAVAGLAAASMAGIWIGAAAPDLVPQLPGAETAPVYDLADLMPGYGDLLANDG